MRSTFIIATSMLVATTMATLSAQTPITTAAADSTTVRLTVSDAVKMALEHNPDLAAARIDPQIGDMQVAAAAGAFRPVFGANLNRNNQLQPPSNFLLPVATRNDATTTDLGVAQRLPWLGTSYAVGWNAVHTWSNSVLNSYNPLVQSGLALNVSQPLVRNRRIDNARQQLVTSRIDREIAGTQLQETVVRTTAAVKTAYWNLATAIANVAARKSVLDSALELVRVNKGKVDVGQAPPLDLVSAQAEVASDQEQLIIAETAVKQAEDQLRTLIYDTRDRSVWTLTIEPVDPPLVGQAPPDLEAAVTNALRDRADLARARKDVDRSQADVTFTENQRLPDVRLDVNYLASGLGGTQVLRTNDFPGTVIGSGGVTGFGTVLDQLFTGRYSTWAVGVSVNYPIGRSTEEAQYARAKLARAQVEQRVRSAEARAIQQVRDAWWRIEMNAKRIDTTRAARELAVERLDAEQKRFDVGKSTSFLVIQAQRDLAQARTNELAATLGYDLSLVAFEALQQAGPEDLTAPTQTAAAGAPASALGLPMQPIPASLPLTPLAPVVSTTLQR
ncbi:MAG: TolC family protein [Bacteroidales bacterium]